MTAGESQTTLADFKQIFLLAEARQLQTLLVGGQAVNFWAAWCEDQEPEIRKYHPLTSKDLDLLGTVDDLYQIACALRLSASRTKRGQPSPVLGVLRFTTPSGMATDIEIFHTLHGVNNDELRAGAGQVFSPDLQVKIRVLSPLVCLKAKTHNAVSLDQARRQDVKHVRILQLCNRAILKTAVAEAEAGRIEERAAIVSLEALFKFTQSDAARRAAAKFDLNWLEAVPVGELQDTSLSRLQKFYRQRLRKAFPACPPPKL